MNAKELGEQRVHPEGALYDGNRSEVNAMGAYMDLGGINLRQHYAGLAMAAVVANPEFPKDLMKEEAGLERASKLAAEVAVAHADALLAELSKEFKDAKFTRLQQAAFKVIDEHVIDTEGLDRRDMAEKIRVVEAAMDELFAAAGGAEARKKLETTT